MVLGKLPVPGRDYSIQGPTALTEVRVGVVWPFYSRLSVLFSFSLSLGDGPI